MIEWLRRVPPDRMFLKTSHRSWTYGETVIEIEARRKEEVVALHPSNTTESVFDLMAGITGGGAIVARPGLDGIAPSDLSGAALVVYTSGTTGLPRGVRLTMANLEAASAASMAHLGHGPDDTWLLAMPLTHVGGLSIVVRSAHAGGSIRLLPGFDPPTFSAAMRHDVTIVSVVPTMLLRVLGHDPGRYGGLRAVLVGGGPIPDGLLASASAAGLPVLPTYGMTETFGQVATLAPGSPIEGRVHPLPGVALRIEPDGRIAVSGAQVSPGYLGEPDRRDQWLVTNDLGDIDDDGMLRVLGRADAVIVTGGEKVDPGRVEGVLRGHPAVEEAVVVGVPDAEWGSAVGCVYSGAVTVPDLGAWMGDRLPGFMVPKRLVRVDAIPRTALGKPDRVAAAELCAAGER